MLITLWNYPSAPPSYVDCGQGPLQGCLPSTAWCICCSLIHSSASTDACQSYGKHEWLVGCSHNPARTSAAAAGVHGSMTLVRGPTAVSDDQHARLRAAAGFQHPGHMRPPCPDWCFVLYKQVTGYHLCSLCMHAVLWRASLSSSRTARDCQHRSLAKRAPVLNSSPHILPFAQSQAQDNLRLGAVVR